MGAWAGNAAWAGGADGAGGGGAPPSEMGWFQPDLADLFAGAEVLLGTGTPITPVSAWAFAGNNVQAEMSAAKTADGFREGYTVRATLAKTRAFWIARGSTEAEVLDGLVTFESWVVPRAAANVRSLVHVGIVDDDALGSMDGSMAGYAVGATAGQLLQSATDRTINTNGDMNGTAAIGDQFHTRQQVTPIYIRTESKAIVGGKPKGWASSRGAMTAGLFPLRLAFNLGNELNNGTNYLADFDVWFRVVNQGYSTAPA